MIDKLPELVTEDEFNRVNYCIRMGDKSRVVEIILNNTMVALSGYLEENKKWLQMQPNERRAELYAVLKVASKKLDAIGDKLMAHSKEHKTG
jgi:hypothetical protein